MVREDLSEKLFAQRSEVGEGMSYADISSKKTPGEENSEWKGPELGACLAGYEKCIQASVPKPSEQGREQ